METPTAGSRIAMFRPPLTIAVAYGVWVAVCLALTVLHIGDAGAGSHLALLFTGFPAALFSVALPNGSLLGVFAAGLLGLLQWVAVALLVSDRSAGVRSRDRA
jgi:hypothetical protein